MCFYSPHTLRLMCVSWIMISIGSTLEVESSSRKMARFLKDVMRKSALKACSWHCRKPLCSARGEWAAASGPLSSRSRTSGYSCLLQGSWSGAEPETHPHTHNINHQQPVINNQECKSFYSSITALQHHLRAIKFCLYTGIIQIYRVFLPCLQYLQYLVYSTCSTLSTYSGMSRHKRQCFAKA